MTQRFLWTARKKALEAWLLPSAGCGGYLACRDGSLVTLFRVDGARSMMGAEQLDHFVESAGRRLNAAFMARGHALHMVFERAPDAGTQSVSNACDRSRRQAGQLGLDLGDLADERERRLGPLCSDEILVLAAWTRPSAMTGTEEKRDQRKSKRKLRHWLPKPHEAQNPYDVLAGLPPRHEALVDTLGAMFRESAITAVRLSDSDALATIRRFINGPDSTPQDWKPQLPSDDFAVRVTDPAVVGGFPPPLAPQLICREPDRAGHRTLRIGTRSYAPLDMELGPRHARPFAELAAAIADAGLPIRFSLLVEGGGLTGLKPGIARISASFLAFSSEDSVHLRDAMRAMADIAADARAVTSLRLGLLTWVTDDETEEILLRRVSRLQQAAEAWGESVFTPITGDPLESVAASIPGFACGGTAVPACAPLSEALRMLPVSRPAPMARTSPNHIFRSPDGRILPWSEEEAEDYGFDVIYGIPGRGKSVLMNSLGLAHLLQGGHSSLPLLAVIDIGPSSSGLISLIKEALPPHRQHEAGHFTLRMSARSAVNPCDTPLGCRRPLPATTALLETLLALMLTSDETDRVPDGIREMIRPAIDAVFALRSDEIAGAEPTLYTPGRDADVDRAIADHGIHVAPDAVWWEIVDSLFDAGQPVAAARAQRYAVPTLSDLAAAARSDTVQVLVGDATLGATGESVTSAFNRILSSFAASWPIAFHATAFDTEGARAAAIDLREIAPRGTPAADRQTAAMYMLARSALTRDWWTTDDDLDVIPTRYRRWHTVRIREIREAPKRLAYDEYHRTGAAHAVRAQVERDVREARKQRIRICLASQRLEDFGESLIELANRYWILGSGGERREVDQLAATFELNETLRDVVRFRLTGPGREGAPVLLIAGDAAGRHEQLLLNTPGPVELWALTTSPTDVALRDRVSERLPPAKARAALARTFPAGTARERIAAEMRGQESRMSRDPEPLILDRLAAEIVRTAMSPAA